MRPAAAFLGLVAACLSVPAGAPKANTLVADLSRHLVGISTGFAGTDVLLFGATESKGDVLVIVRMTDSTLSLPPTLKLESARRPLTET